MQNHEKNEDSLPIYIHVLMFFGAFIGFCLINSILALTGILQPNDFQSYIVPGLVFIGLSFAFYFLFQQASPLMHSFATQSSFILMFSGKLLLVGAAYLKFDTPWDITIALGIVTLGTYFIYANVLDRFLFSSLFLISFMMNLIVKYETTSPIFCFFVFLLLSIFALYHSTHLERRWKPFEAALIFTICILSVFLSIDFSEVFKINWDAPPIAFNVALAIYLIMLTLRCSGSIESLKKLPVLFACIGLIVLSIISTAGILWAIALLMMGYQKNKISLLTLGGVFLIFFLTFYYYDLSLSLEHKSFLLIGNGLSLLLIRAVMKHLKWDQL